MNSNQTIERVMQVVFPVIGIILGIAFIVAGTQVSGLAQDIKFYPGPYGYGNTTHLGEIEFGADFYTEVYKATAFSGNALKGIVDLLGFAIPAVLILSGLLIIWRSARELLPALMSAASTVSAAQPVIMSAVEPTTKPAAAPMAESTVEQPLASGAPAPAEEQTPAASPDSQHDGEDSPADRTPNQ